MLIVFAYEAYNLVLVKFCRTIGDMDIKLDLIPPSLMNFISRQLIGNGFRLYKKVRQFGFLISFVLMYRCTVRKATCVIMFSYLNVTVSCFRS